ncbi:hypothetical protein [Aquimarina sp. 2201CG14-23]|uniref:hypothetical protein n=1 Tax=Aquimarina mycalae TaxID=3040073 RepID=UPI00247826E9|nr:hypothetical protein [Aquimarina sp. 2201CG14-23]MDH7447584.1 hypothetical protein [Aquimarina sp. 2201CG14-23]
MRNLIYIFVILFSIQTNAQNSTDKGWFRIDLLTYEKTTNDTIRGAIIELYSGQKRLEVYLSDFDGKSNFIINEKDIVDKNILLKVHGPKCSIFEKEYNITGDLETIINLEYGESEYTHFDKRGEIYKKLKIKSTFLKKGCGAEN